MLKVLLLGKPSHSVTQILCRRCRALDNQLTSFYGDRNTPGNLHRRQQLRRLRPFQPLHIQQGNHRSLHHCSQRPKMLEQLSPELDGAGPLEANADEDRHQLRVRQCLRAPRQQPLSWPLFFGPRDDAFGFAFNVLHRGSAILGRLKALAKRLA